MRWIVYSLIIINIAIPAYFLLQPDVQETALATTAAVADANEGDTLQLRRERDSGAAPAPQRPLRDVTGKKLCYALGPYTDGISARVAQARAMELSLTGLINELQVPNMRDAEYWVHMPPLSNRREALDTLKELQRRGIDSYVITQGDLVDGISLGLFRSEASANTLTAKVRGLGFASVGIREMGATDTEYWVEIREISKLDDRARRRVKADDGDVDWQMVACRHQGSE